MEKLPKCGANYVPLSPVTFLERAASVYGERTSVIYGQTRFTWKQTYERCRRLASSLRSLNISKNDVVSVLAPNIPALYEMHFAVPMAGAILNTMNTRLSPGNIATILRHSDAQILFVDHQYLRLATDALKLLVHADKTQSSFPLLVVIDDVDTPTGSRMGELEYERLIAVGDPDFPAHCIADEWDPISLNYTSGTTAAPKGVVYSHRGTYLSAVGILLQWGVGGFPIYLWTLPMFHCNGWAFPWAIAARGGTNVCIRGMTAGVIYRAIFDHGVTHMCCAPTVISMLLEGKPADCNRLPSPVQILTGGAPPPASLLEKIQLLGFRVTHAYGLTEATATALVCEWRPEWDRLSRDEQAWLKARQGVSALTLADVDVKDADTMVSVPRDGKTMGEIVLRGSSIMKGYYKNDEDTARAFRDGWFLTGDVGVMHPDGYVQVKDRSKDVIISGGENISSVEVESVLYRHPKVAEAAVVAMPHPRWGETPCAFVKVKEGEEMGEREVMEFCRGHMARFMVPKKVVFVEALPRTSTGKIVKFELREMAKHYNIGEEEKKKAVIDQSNDQLGFAVSRL